MSYAPGEVFVMSSSSGESNSTTLRYLDSQLTTAKCLRFIGMRTQDIGFLLAHPLVEKIEFVNCTYDMATFVPRTSEHVPGAREVVLADTTYSLVCFDIIFRSFPKLRKLTYFYPSNEPDNNFDDVATALNNHGRLLEDLAMHNDHSRPFDNYIGSMAHFSNLKTLEIDLEFLIGFRPIPRGDWDEYTDSPYDVDEEDPDYDEIHESFGDWSFVELLPTSIETLTIEVDSPKLQVYFNTYERFGAKFEELMTAVEYFPNLKHVEAENLYLVAERAGNRLPNWVIEDSHIMTKRVVTAAEPAADAIMSDLSIDSMTDQGEDA
ncbi:hypothetical protein F4678DRAFT_164266 [Xylaria arbuscula]|nr:hypothetical protein F4678DRAFT_164266 [Xylaria arbuscula]